MARTIMMAPLEEWELRSLCGAPGQDPDEWFPKQGNNSANRARRACAGCLVRAQCLDRALRLPNKVTKHGIWAGLSGGELERLRREQAAA